MLRPDLPNQINILMDSSLMWSRAPAFLRHINCKVYCSLADPRGAPGTRAPHWGPNSFIFMLFSAKIINKHTHFGSWRPPPGKILDPPLLFVYGYESQGWQVPWLFLLVLGDFSETKLKTKSCPCRPHLIVDETIWNRRTWTHDLFEDSPFRDQRLTFFMAAFLYWVICLTTHADTYNIVYICPSLVWFDIFNQVDWNQDQISCI